MQLASLFKIQEIIESKIAHFSNMDENALGKENTFDLRFLALQIKTGELANLTKCYKYKYVLSSDTKEKLMIRYLDAIKFLLSIGNQHQFNIIDLEAIHSTEKIQDLIPLFSKIYDDISLLKQKVKDDAYVDALSQYIQLFAHYMHLGETLGFTMPEVFRFFETMLSNELILDK
jgi:dimeric dUTPase (all-alpha-NTP-PPase superfamily)